MAHSLLFGAIVLWNDSSLAMWVRADGYSCTIVTPLRDGGTSFHENRFKHMVLVDSDILASTCGLVVRALHCRHKSQVRIHLYKVRL